MWEEENDMQRRIRYHRVRLIAYDALLLQHACLPTQVPSPSPTPLAPIVPVVPLARSLLKPSRQRVLRKTRLVYERSKIADA